jgi:hypothetical protein
LEHIYIGGATAMVYPTDSPNIVKVKVENTTGKESLFLHVANDIERNTIDAKSKKLSDIKQILIFYTEIDVDTFK